MVASVFKARREIQSGQCKAVQGMNFVSAGIRQWCHLSLNTFYTIGFAKLTPLLH